MSHSYPKSLIFLIQVSPLGTAIKFSNLSSILFDPIFPGDPSGDPPGDPRNVR